MKKLLSMISVLLVAAMILPSCANVPGGDETTGSAAVETTGVETEEETAFPATETEIVTETETETETEIETETERDPIRVEGLTLDKYSVSIVEGSYDMPWVTMTPADADDKSELWSSDNTAVATVDAYGNIYGVSAGDCTVTVASVDNPEARANVAVHVDPKPAETTPPAPETQPAPPDNPSSIYEPAPPVSGHPGLTYINGTLIANKTYSLPSDYNPGVDPTAYAALMDMFAGAASEGVSLWVASGFRSYDTQNWLYNNYVAMDGKAAADMYSARPGHSEHQTGLAFDLNVVADYFAWTVEGVWLANNCWKYGFIIRYPAGKEGITGYKYEPWHVRYVGTDLSKILYESGLTIEEYFGITSVYSY